MPALILMYHDLAVDVTKVTPGHRPYVLEPSTFLLQMQAVAAQNLPALCVTQWCTSPGPSRAILLTFDDGHVSNHDVALPILVERQLTATFFIVAGRIATGETMNWRQIRALQAAGMEIGSHTFTHRPPSTLDDDALRYELLESRRILEDGLGAPVTAISSPTGFFNPRMRSIAREVGYSALCCGQVGLAADHADPWSLRRIAVKRGMGMKQFNDLVRLDPSAIRRLRVRQVIRDLARKSVGLNVYLGMRRMLMRGGRHA